MKKLSLLLLLAVLCVVSARAEEITIDFQNEQSHGLPSSAGSNAILTGTGNDITITTSGNAYWTDANSNKGRLVVNASAEKAVTFTANNNCTITKIVFTVPTSDNWMKIDGVNTTNNTWEGNATQLLLSNSKKSLSYILTITITYTKPAPPETVIFNPAEGSIPVNHQIIASSTGADSISYTIKDSEKKQVSSGKTDASSITFNMPETVGTYKVEVTAKNVYGKTNGSATYDLYIPAPEAITFTPESGVIDMSAEINVSSTGATKLVYTINDETGGTIDGDSGTIPTPKTPGSYEVKVTASNNGQLTTEGTAIYVIVDNSSTASYVRCLNATDLKAGASIYIGDPNQSPFTLMGDMVSGNALFAEGATLEDFIVTDAGFGTRLYLIPASEGKWYLVNADNAYLYSAQPNYLQFRSDGHKSEYAIEIGGDGLARISTPYVVGMASEDIFIAHSTLNESDTYLSLYAGNIGSDAHRTYPCIYYQGKPSAPGDVYFNPAGGEVVAGTKVTIIAPDATSITYTYKKETVTVDGESVTVTVDKPGTIEVTATNRIGDTTGQATYTIAPDVIYHTLTSTNSSTTWSLPASGDWMWYHTSDGYCLLYYPFDETDPNDNIAYDPENIILRKDNSVKYSVMFEQSQSDADAKFAIRKVITNEEDPDYPATAWEFLDIQSNNSRADFQTAEVNINNYNGDTVQIGLKGGKPDWSVKDMQVVSRIKTAIETVEVDVEEADAPVVFYNLQGMRVNAENMTPGIYVRLQGKKATKVLVR